MSRNGDRMRGGSRPFAAYAVNIERQVAVRKRDGCIVASRPRGKVVKGRDLNEQVERKHPEGPKWKGMPPRTGQSASAGLFTVRPPRFSTWV